MKGTLEQIVKDKISAYMPKGGLDHTARLFLALCKVNHKKVLGHNERVALLAEAVAIKLELDPKAAFFAGLLHDLCKIILPAEMFEGREINAEEYARIKTHAIAGYEVLKEFHTFTALCAGLHHALYQKGYGLTIRDFPSDWNMATIKKVLDISIIVSICDFIDAFTHRKTKILDGSGTGNGLKEMLVEKYPDCALMIKYGLSANEKISKLKGVV